MNKHIQYECHPYSFTPMVQNKKDKNDVIFLFIYTIKHMVLKESPNISVNTRHGDL